MPVVGPGHLINWFRGPFSMVPYYTARIYLGSCKKCLQIIGSVGLFRWYLTTRHVCRHFQSKYYTRGVYFVDIHEHEHSITEHVGWPNQQQHTNVFPKKRETQPNTPPPEQQFPSGVPHYQLNNCLLLLTEKKVVDALFSHALLVSARVRVCCDFIVRS